MGSRLIETGRPRTCNISTEESYPSTEPKLDDWRGAPSRSSCWVTKRSSTTATPQASSSDTYPSPKVRSYCKKYTRGLAVITQHLEPSLEMPSDKVSTGRPRWPTPLGLYAPAKGVNSTQGRHTCPLRPCKQYPSPGCLLCGVWTSSVPCRRHPGGFTHLLVAIDKFSKWIEVQPLNSIRSEQVVAFFIDIIHRFGVLNSIITDNGTQFTGRKFLDFCEDHHIRVDWAAVAHPMMNGQVERANDMILQGLKPRIYNDLNKFGRRWMKELPKPSHGLHTVFSSLWGRGYLAHRLRIRLPKDKGVRRPKQPDQPRRLIGPAGRGSGHGLTTLGTISAVSATLPCPRGSVPRPPGGGLGASATTRCPRAPQAHTSLGRAVHHRQDFEARNIQVGQ
jgi:transposase InsO family protein